MAGRTARKDAATRSAALVLVAMTLANALVLVDQTAVPLSLPSIAADLHVTTQSAQWVLNSSLLPLAGMLVLGGRLGDWRRAHFRDQLACSVADQRSTCRDRRLHHDARRAQGRADA